MGGEKLAWYNGLELEAYLEDKLLECGSSASAKLQRVICHSIISLNTRDPENNCLRETPECLVN